MNLRSIAYVALTSLLSLPACVGTDTGNPPVAASLTVRSSDPEVVIAPATGEVVIERAWIALAEVRATLGETCDHVSEPHDRDVVGDIVAGLPLAGLPAEPICGVYLILHAPPGPTPGAPPAFQDRSFFVEGRLGDGTPFEISSDYAMGIDVIGPSLFALSPDGGALIVFDVASWVAGLDLAALPPDADGVVRLGPAHPDAATVEMGLIGSIELYEDTDGDGILGPMELGAGPVASSH